MGAKNLIRLMTVPSLIVQAFFVASIASATRGSDSLQLDTIPLDTRIDCDRTFFRSSQRFPGTIFVMPRAVLGVSRAEEDLFKIEPDGAGGYILSIGLYFPRDEETLKPKRENDAPVAGSCNFESVQYFLNKGITEPKNQIHTIARMPLTSIDVSLPGVNEVATIGRSLRTNDDVDILNYHGADYTAEFHLNENEKNGVMRRLQRRQGLPINLTFRFQARSYDGSVRAEINWQELAINLNAAASGRAAVTKAELHALLGYALQKTKIRITTEEGKTGAVEKIATRILDQVLQNREAVPNSSLAPQNDSTALVNLGATISFLTRQSDREIEFQEIGQSETATAATVINFTSRLIDPNIREIYVVAGGADPTLDEPILKGQTIRIAMAYSNLVKVTYKEHKTYLTAGQVSDLGLYHSFPDLASGKMKIENRELYGSLVGVGRWNYSNPGALLNVYSPSYFSWIRTERYEYTEGLPTTRIAPTLDAWKTYPIYLTFSQLGRRLRHLTEVVGDNADFNAVFDEQNGSLVITAKRDLGLMTIRENFGKQTEDLSFQDVVTDEVVQEAHNPITNATTVSAPVVLKKADRSAAQRRVVVIYVSRPQ